MMKIFVRCVVCNKKIRIKLDSFDEKKYVLSEGSVEIIDGKLFFYCEKHSKIPQCIVH